MTNVIKKMNQKFGAMCWVWFLLHFKEKNTKFVIFSICFFQISHGETKKFLDVHQQIF